MCGAGKVEGLNKNQNDSTAALIRRQSGNCLAGRHSTLNGSPVEEMFSNLAKADVEKRHQVTSVKASSAPSSQVLCQVQHLVTQQVVLAGNGGDKFTGVLVITPSCGCLLTCGWPLFLPCLLEDLWHPGSPSGQLVLACRCDPEDLDHPTKEGGKGGKKIYIFFFLNTDMLLPKL